MLIQPLCSLPHTTTVKKSLASEWWMDPDSTRREGSPKLCNVASPFVNSWVDFFFGCSWWMHSVKGFRIHCKMTIKCFSSSAMPTSFYPINKIPTPTVYISGFHRHTSSTSSAVKKFYWLFPINVLGGPRPGGENKSGSWISKWQSSNQLKWDFFQPFACGWHRICKLRKSPFSAGGTVGMPEMRFHDHHLIYLFSLLLQYAKQAPAPPSPPRALCRQTLPAKQPGCTKH